MSSGVAKCEIFIKLMPDHASLTAAMFVLLKHSDETSNFYVLNSIGDHTTYLVLVGNVKVLITLWLVHTPTLVPVHTMCGLFIFYRGKLSLEVGISPKMYTNSHFKSTVCQIGSFHMRPKHIV